jgi:hypothetical protein
MASSSTLTAGRFSPRERSRRRQRRNTSWSAAGRRLLKLHHDIWNGFRRQVILHVDAASGCGVRSDTSSRATRGLPGRGRALSPRDDVRHQRSPTGMDGRMYLIGLPNMRATTTDAAPTATEGQTPTVTTARRPGETRQMDRRPRQRTTMVSRARGRTCAACVLSRPRAAR